jgi:hypothetical protein
VIKKKKRKLRVQAIEKLGRVNYEVKVTGGKVINFTPLRVVTNRELNLPKIQSSGRYVQYPGVVNSQLMNLELVR